MPLVRSVSIENFKSIRKLSFELGQVNVLIGANGSGKSNILEAIALSSAESRGKADNEYLVPRGIRVTEPRFMRSALREAEDSLIVQIRIQKDDDAPPYATILAPELGPPLDQRELVFQTMQALAARAQPKELDALRKGSAVADIVAHIADSARSQVLMDQLWSRMQPPDFVIYAPENSALRTFQSEGQLLPLGSRGDGLFAHLKKLNAAQSHLVAQIADQLALLDWFERLEVPKDLAPGERSILIRDRYLAEGALFDQRSANEGFLFLLFYFTLLISPQTPAFFAIDNVETALNPKLCTEVMRRIVGLAKASGKQIVVSTHSPAVLDGLDLSDADGQRLFVTERRRDGDTRVRRIDPPKASGEGPPMKLSEAFAGGYLGGLPKNF